MLVLAYPGYRESHFPDARAAREGGRNWLPALLPDAAQDIRTLVNLDTMQSWDCFRLPGGTSEFRARLAAAGAIRRQGEMLPRAEKMLGRVDWWPAAMSEPGVERYDLPSSTGGAGLMIGLSPRDDRVCFCSKGNSD